MLIISLCIFEGVADDSANTDVGRYATETLYDINLTGRFLHFEGDSKYRSLTYLHLVD